VSPRLQTVDVSGLVVDKAGRFRVDSSVQTSEEIFELELRRIFYRTWVYVGHESEVPTPGDYRTTVIGRQPVILSRDEDGRLHVVLNRCMHRGAVVCRAERGHSNHFRCPYHNWVYRNDGTLVGMAQRGGYPDDFDRSELSLVRVPRVESYRGLIFASMNPDVVPLTERLGRLTWYIDQWCDRSPTGTISVTSGVHRYSYPGNWKFQLENGVDGYHGNYVHDSFVRILERSGERSRNEVVSARNDLSTRNYAKGLSGGDGMLERSGGMLGTFDYRDHPEYEAQLRTAHGEGRVDDILTQRNILIFPNVYLFESHIRVIRPVSPSETIVDNFPTLLDGATQEVNAARLAEHERFFGPASFGATDDIEIFTLNQTGVLAEHAQWLDFSRGLHREATNEHGEQVGHSTDEVPQRSLYREWFRLMSSGVEQSGTVSTEAGS
jgi:benzoate/toluate 1,2-dioxygenase alpha subunit